MHFYTLRFYLCLIYIFLFQMNQCWPPLQVLCLWPQQNLGLGVGPKSYFHVDNLFLTLPLLNFIRYFSHFHSFKSKSDYIASMRRISIPVICDVIWDHTNLFPTLNRLPNTFSRKNRYSKVGHIGFHKPLPKIA